jgi:hypothetical protein
MSVAIEDCESVFSRFQGRGEETSVAERSKVCCLAFLRAARDQVFAGASTINAVQT